MNPRFKMVEIPEYYFNIRNGYTFLVPSCGYTCIKPKLKNFYLVHTLYSIFNKISYNVTF